MRQRLVQLIVIALALLGCGGTALSKDVLPQGISLKASMPGVYAGADRGGCCWLAPAASFSAIEPKGSTVMLLQLAAPPYAVTGEGTPITVRIGEDAPYRACCVRPGVQEIPVPLNRRAAATRAVRIHISSERSFVPAQRGLGIDTRHLTFLLEKVTFFDTITGARYVDGVNAESSPAQRRILAANWAVIFAGALLAFFLVRRDAAFAWIALLITAPFDFSVPVAGTTMTLAKSVLVACALALAFRRGALNAFKDPELYLPLAAIVLFLASMCISDAHATYAAAAVRETFKGAQYALTAIVAYCAYRVAPRPHALRTAAVWSVLLVCAMALSQEIAGAPQARMLFDRSIPRIGGPLEGPNQLGAYLGIMIPVILAFALPGRPRLLDAGAVLLGAAVLFLTFSRGGVLACALAVAVVVALRYLPARARTIAWGAGVAWLALAAVVVLALGGISALSAVLGPPDAFNGGLSTRGNLWHAALELWRTSPVFGIGPGNYELRVGNILPGVRTHPNNYFIQVLAEQGVLGLAAFLGLNLTLLWGSMRSARTVVGAAAVAVVFGLAAHQLLDGLLLYPKVGIVFFTIIAIGLAQAALQRQAEVTETVHARTALAL